jgi:leucyl-tRNA synthetase
LEPYPENSPLRNPALAGKKVFLAPATLRPETMYGQTNCFVLPEGDYGAFAVSATDVFICSERSARNMAYQGLAVEKGLVDRVAAFKGEDLLGLPLAAPHAVYETVYALPLLTISMKKGTGVVTSVPSDAPDDWAALRDLKNKPAVRAREDGGGEGAAGGHMREEQPLF